MGTFAARAVRIGEEQNTRETWRKERETGAGEAGVLIVPPWFLTVGTALGGSDAHVATPFWAATVAINLVGAVGRWAAVGERRRVIFGQVNIARTGTEQAYHIAAELHPGTFKEVDINS